MPPSTGRSTPAMKLASSDARNKAVDAISSGRPSRPRDGRGELGAGLVGAFLGRRLLVENRRVDRTWADRIDADAAVLQLGRPGADEGADCRLGGAVGGEAGDALVLGARCDHEDRPAVVQKRQGLLDREGQAARVDRKDLVVAFLRRLGERVRIDDARPGEQDVDLALLPGDLGVEPVEIGEVGHVTLHCGDTAADQRYRLVQFRLAAPGDVDERAFFDEALGGGETYSAAAACDDSDFSFELLHCNPLPKWERMRADAAGDGPRSQRCVTISLSTRSAS